MRGSLRGRIGSGALVLLCAAGLLSPFPRTAAAADNGYYDSGPGESRWLGSGDTIARPGTSREVDEKTPFFSLRIGALAMTRSSPQDNLVVTDSSSGTPLLSTSQINPGWAGGMEVDFLLDLSDTMAFEFVWFNLDDWLDQQSVVLGGTSINQVPFPVESAGISTSSRLRDMEFNIREQLYERVTFLAGIRYVEFLDSIGAHYESPSLGAAEDKTIFLANKMYGVQLGVLGKLWSNDCWAVDGWVKAGVFGNSTSLGASITSSGIPPQGDGLRALGGRAAFVTDMGLRGTRRIGQHLSFYAGYRFMYMDGVALAPNQYDRVVNGFITGIPSITIGNSILFQGIEAGLTFTF